MQSETMLIEVLCSNYELYAGCGECRVLTQIGAMGKNTWLKTQPNKIAAAG